MLPYKALRRVPPVYIALLLVLAGLASTSCGPPATQLAGSPILPPSTTAAAGAQATGWYDLYFTTPAVTAKLTNPTGGIPEKIAASFDTARQTIDLAIYQFDLLPLADALLRAKARGVQIRAVTDSDSFEMDAIRALAQAGVPVVPDERQPIMHDKFAVIDGAIVWTGSMNYTYSDAYRNDNNVIEIRSTQLAQNYTHEFEKMFVSKKFDAHLRVDTPNPLVAIGGARIETYFAPNGKVAAHIEDVLSGAAHSIYFMAFAFTRRDFGQTLLDQAAAGLDVRGVFEGEQLAAGGDTVWKMLTNGGMAEDIRKDGNPKNMHNKVFVVDQAIVVTGSYNFSTAAEDLNDENALIIHDPAIAATYYAQWERIWAQGK
jgi:phosphatidylserine/phosphatidylglycerophosphate/cardiolipin synthase-like enzyme